MLRDRRDWAGAAAALRRAIALRPDTPGALLRAGAGAPVGRRQEARGARAIAEGERLRRRTQLEHEALVWTAVGTAQTR